MAAKYGYRHQQLRKRWKLQVARDDVPCARCGLLIDPSQEWDLGHDDDNPTLYSGPEHRHARDCPEGGNRATLTHARALVTKDKEDYTDHPLEGSTGGLPALTARTSRFGGAGRGSTGERKASSYGLTRPAPQTARPSYRERSQVPTRGKSPPARDSRSQKA
jgi:hypothetical protein